MPPACAIGVDIGGTVTKIALVQADGVILHQENIPTGSHTAPEKYLARLKEILQEIAFGDQARPAGIGLALPGFLSPDRHEITFNPNTPELVGIDFFHLLQPLGLPLHIEQDLNVPLVAEYHLGAGKGSHRCMSASIGTGLGAAVILNGRLLDFSSHTIGDSGHIILDPDGPTCMVGCHGCGEALISVPAVERVALRMVAELDFPPPWAAMKDGKIPARNVIKACQVGDPLAIMILSEIGTWLGQWLASLAPIFLPDTVVLCGGVAEAGEPLRAACERRFLEIAGPEYTHCTIKLGSFKGLAGVIGAALPLLLGSKKR
jgi:glucokinase